MFTKTRLGIFTLLVLAGLIAFSYFFNRDSKPYKMMPSKTFSFDFKKDVLNNNILGLGANSSQLEKIFQKDIPADNGTYAVYVENMQSGEKFSLNEKEVFPAASLYKLILMAAILKEVEAGNLSLDERISDTKGHLTKVLGSVDFGYENVSGTIGYTVDEALTRVGRISDNFAAIMLTEKLRRVRLSKDSSQNGLLFQMADELGMERTDFDSDPIDTTAEDIAIYFKQLYQRKIVSDKVSQQIIDYLSLSNINNRIPAKLPKKVNVVHKTGELVGVRHDAGIVYLDDTQTATSSAYTIVLLSKDLQHEDDAIDALAQISQDVYGYFSQKGKGD